MVKTALKTIMFRTLLIGGVLAVSTMALYARTETTGTTFATYGIDLKIDNRAFYNGSPVPGSTWELKDLIPTSDKFFNFNDIKPGDYGRSIISAHVKKSPAFICLDFINLTDNENSINEPESILDINGMTAGELADGTEFFGWLDDGDTNYEPGEKILFGTGDQSASIVLDETTYTVGDSSSGGSCEVGETKYVGLMWCAGNLSVNTLTGAVSCDATTLGNEAQTDSFTVDVKLRAVPSYENPYFNCDGTTTRVPTRTQGFWQTHTKFTSKVFALPTMQKFIGINSLPTNGSHKGTISNVQTPGASELFGAFYSSISKKTDGTNRSSTDKKRMQLLQQLVTAKLNCAMVTCSTTTLTLISDADTAYKLGSANMLDLAEDLDNYNNSGDSLPLPGSLGSPGSATPGTSQSYANKVFWNAP